MNKRERVLSMVQGGSNEGYVPAAFFLHFPQDCHRGQAAIDKHLEFFGATDMDFVKIQYEFSFPHHDDIVTPGDWANMPIYGIDYYQEQIDVVEGLVKAAGKEALVIVTLYSPFMSAGHTVGDELLMAHIEQDAEAVQKGMARITESLLTFVRGAIDVGVDGFYASTQGGEVSRLGSGDLFQSCAKAYDLVLMEEMAARCSFNILHVCDYTDSYASFAPFLDYPGHVVNAPMHTSEAEYTACELADMFGRPFMGGMERLGAILNGTQDEIVTAAEAALAQAPSQYILGADCTIPSEVDWANIRTAIDVAHAWQG